MGSGRFLAANHREHGFVGYDATILPSSPEPPTMIVGTSGELGQNISRTCPELGDGHVHSRVVLGSRKVREPTNIA